MRLATAIGQMLRTSWKQAAGTTLTVVTLSAVAIVGLTFLASDVLASWKTSANGEQATASSKISEGPLTFDAPTSTLLRLQATAKAAQMDKDLASNAPLLAKNWKYTQLSPPDAWQLSWTLFFQASFLRIAEEFIDSLQGTVIGPFVNQQLADQLFTAVYNQLVGLQGLVNAQIPPAFLQLIPPAFRPPVLQPASPSV